MNFRRTIRKIVSFKLTGWLSDIQSYLSANISKVCVHVFFCNVYPLYSNWNDWCFVLLKITLTWAHARQQQHQHQRKNCWKKNGHIIESEWQNNWLPWNWIRSLWSFLHIFFLPCLFIVILDECIFRFVHWSF